MIHLRRMIMVGLLMAAVPSFGALASTSPEPVASPAPTTSPSPSSSTETTAQRIANLKTRGAAEITRRISNLNSALTALNQNSKLSPQDKTALSGQVQTELNGLSALQSKLAADTTLDACRADVQSIVSDYRVYVLLLPKVRMVTVTDSFTTAEVNLTSLQTQLQAAVDTQKAAGKDVTTLQASLDDMQTKTAAATALTSQIVTKLLALQPTDYNTDHTILESYRTSLGTALTDLKAAQTDAKSVAAATS